MMNLSFNQVQDIASEMAKASNEIAIARGMEGYKGDDEYIGYREGLYDAYHSILITLGYSIQEIDELEDNAKLTRFLRG